jgi:hypothetical protein
LDYRQKVNAHAKMVCLHEKMDDKSNKICYIALSICKEYLEDTKNSFGNNTDETYFDAIIIEDPVKFREDMEKIIEEWIKNNKQNQDEKQ